MNWKKEWTDQETVNVMHRILLWLNSRKFETKHYGVLRNIHTIEELDRLFGFPYTSSGRAAGVWVTNTELYLDSEKKYHVYGFGKDTAGIIYAVCYDNNENELLIPINK